MINALKKVGIGATAVVLVGLALLIPVSVRTASATQEVSPANTADYFKAKCSACHGQKAEKKFDAALPDDQLVDVVLKGKKVEKPPNMPSFEAKGVTAEQAKSLVDLMKQLKATAAN